MKYKSSYFLSILYTVLSFDLLAFVSGQNSFAMAKAAGALITDADNK